MRTLQLNDYLKIRYNDNKVYCLVVTPKGINENEKRKEEKKRNEEIVIPRQIVMYLCSKYTDCSSTKIGEFLGKDHSTVLHGVSKMEADLQNDENIKNKVDIIIKKLNVN